MNLETTCMETWTLRDGATVVMRHIKPTDAALEKEFVDRLSVQTKFQRFQAGLRTLSKQQLEYLTNPDPGRSVALIAVHQNSGSDEEIAVARYVMDADKPSAQFAIVVADAWQRRGIGKLLLSALIAHAQSAGITNIFDCMFQSNLGMRKLAKQLGFVETRVAGEPENIHIAKTRVEPRLQTTYM